MELPLADNNIKAVAIFSHGIARIPNLTSFLGADSTAFNPGEKDTSKVGMVVGWGRKPNTIKARDWAEKHNIPFIRLEDGFLRSCGLGVQGDPPLSLVWDDCGIYYDATRPSRLENLLQHPKDNADPLSDPALLTRAEECINKIVSTRLSKYNNSPSTIPDLPFKTDKERVLVIDQTFGDISVQRGMMHPGGFKEMLVAAVRENPDAEIVVKTHPDVLAGKKRGYLTNLEDNSNITLLAAPINPIELIESVSRVYTVSSQMGFEALMVGKPVTCFGVPFYSGWGLTDDRVPCERRTHQRSLTELFAAAYILYPRYLHPDTNLAGEIEDVIDHLSLQRRYFKLNAGDLFCFGFWFWKHHYIRQYLHSPANKINFCRTAGRAKRLGFQSSSRLVVWGIRDKQPVKEMARTHEVSTWRMEDGFLRSIGLGSDLTVPASLVLDTRGIYYDPNHPSDLEVILETSEFSDEDVLRAQKLREKIVASKVSKYNVDGGDRIELDNRENKRVILVPGQVEGDASIRLGCLDIKANEALLREVRRQNEDAFIIFKPHPDVVSGNKKGKVPADAMAELCDVVIEDASLAHCLDVADEVHTMTSLVGFEALLRGLQVSVYGRPFYSGWGLTTDRHKVDRRTRKLSLDQLVAGTLIQYPRYINVDTGRFTTPEYVVSKLEQGIHSKQEELQCKLPWHKRQFGKLKQIVRGLYNVR